MLRFFAKGTAVTLAVLVIGAFVSSVATFRTPEWWGEPWRLHWCGRDYARSPKLVTRSQIHAGSLPGDKPYKVRRIGSLPPIIGRPVLASVTPDKRRQSITPPLPCTMELYLRTSSGKYRP